MSYKGYERRGHERLRAFGDPWVALTPCTAIWEPTHFFGEKLYQGQGPLMRHHTDTEAWQDSSAGTDSEAAIVGIPLGSVGQVATLVAFFRLDEFSGFEMQAAHDLRRALIAFEAHVRLWERRERANESCSAMHPRGLTDPQRLTSRELEVIQLLSEGLLASTIAARLDVSPRTVHAHLASAYRKLEAHDRLTAVNRAREMGIIGAAGSAG
jgi:DNA-binding CsgD family transcriptional regulator